MTDKEGSEAVSAIYINRLLIEEESGELVFKAYFSSEQEALKFYDHILEGSVFQNNKQ